jgi:hypothetical protein
MTVRKIARERLGQGRERHQRSVSVCFVIYEERDRDSMKCLFEQA